MEDTDNMIDERAVEALMKFMGYERISDYVDDGACSPCSDISIWQFFNPITKKGVQFCIGDYDNQLLFSEDHTIEIDEKWDKKTGEKIFQGKIEVEGEPKGKLKCPKCTWDNKTTVDPKTGECLICNRFYEIKVLPAN